ncbi:hypothetical protein BKA65DRAFT_398116 [Rhexocercosporidium sp. MPI-PUGE-AT-0058]|nr:hypothetical protein BKA65DRAFT_398116 [Rhexocercosporidium sp. MPI-PUGE-AT-0058]
MKRRRCRESHNAVEGRRRDNINERIQDLSRLVSAKRLEDEKIRKHLIVELSSATELCSDTKTSNCPTPRSLGWAQKDSRVDRYHLVVKRGETPYLELLAEFEPSSLAPSRVYLNLKELPAIGFVCPDHECPRNGMRFSRAADLERHYKSIHVSRSEHGLFPCDYAHCDRNSEPFGRKDHFRDHLRDFHKEDIGTARIDRFESDKEWSKQQRKWLSERKVSSGWWRCSQCLNRVHVKDKGWECPRCKSCCEPSRNEHRQRLQISDGTQRCLKDGKDCSTPDCTTHFSTCSGDFGNAQDFFGHLDDCPRGAVRREAPGGVLDSKPISSVFQQQQMQTPKLDVVTHINDEANLSNLWTSK